MENTIKRCIVLPFFTGLKFEHFYAQRQGELVSTLPVREIFFLFILSVFCAFFYLCRPSEASIWYSAIPGDNPPKD
jgi:hypothetical protein